jgi:hypothetical protein
MVPAIGGMFASRIEIRVENLEAIEDDLDVIVVGDELFVVPLPDRPQIPANGRYEAVNAAVVLIVVKPGVLGSFVVQDLNLEALVGGIHVGPRGTDRQTIVAARR